MAYIIVIFLKKMHVRKNLNKLKNFVHAAGGGGGGGEVF